jgi:hypothetical protein
MPLLHHYKLGRIKFLSQTARKQSLNNIDWPANVIEDIVGVPDVLNETLANHLVRINIKKEKEKQKNAHLLIKGH